MHFDFFKQRNVLVSHSSLILNSTKKNLILLSKMEITVRILPQIYEGFILHTLGNYFYSYLFDDISCNISGIIKLNYHYII